jgi:hypothetical protein
MANDLTSAFQNLSIDYQYLGFLGLQRVGEFSYKEGEYQEAAAERNNAEVPILRKYKGLKYVMSYKSFYHPTS